MTVLTVVDNWLRDTAGIGSQIQICKLISINHLLKLEVELQIYSAF